MSQIIHKSPLKQLDIPELPLGDYILQQYNQNPELLGEKTAIIDGDTGDVWNFREFSNRVATFAGGLAKRGVKAGSVVALIAPNCPAFAISFHAVIRLGATVTTVNPQYTSREIRQQLNESNPLITITTSDKFDTIVEAASGTSVNSIILLDENEIQTESRSDDSGQLNISYWTDCLESPRSQQPLDARSSVAVLPFSSGTTGIPKGVMLSHFNLVANVIQTNSAQGYKAGDVALAVLPFFHIYGMQVLMNCLLALQIPIVTMRRFDMETALALIEKHRVTRFFAVPPIVLGLAKHSAIEQYDISSLQQVFSGAAPLGGDIAEEAARRIDCPVVQGYGMTELSPVSHLTVGDDYKAGSSGVAIANTECRIVDEKGNDQPYGEVGELWVRGPQVMLGYHNNETATQECLDDDGWLHTGDIARIDEDNHMTIVDRLKELIKYKGFQIAPAELEATIVSFPEVADVAVIGVADADSGEAPKAFIKMQTGENLSLSELNQRLATELSSYKQIRELEIIDQIPKSASGKILRQVLRKSQSANSN